MFKNHGKIERIQDYNDKQFFDYIFGKKLEEKIVQLTELINSKDIFERYQLADYLWDRVVEKARYHKPAMKVLPYLVPYLENGTNKYLDDVLFKLRLIYTAEDAFLIGKLLDYEKYGELDILVRKLVICGELDMIKFIVSYFPNYVLKEELIEYAILFGWFPIVEWLLPTWNITDPNPFELKHLDFDFIFNFNADTFLNPSDHSHENVIFVWKREYSFEFELNFIPIWFKFINMKKEFRDYLPSKHMVLQWAGFRVDYPNREMIHQLRSYISNDEIWELVKHWESYLLDLI